MMAIPAFNWINDPINKNNLQILNTPLKKGEHFEAKAGTISIVKNETVWQKIAYYFSESRHNKEVKQAINAAVVGLSNELKDLEEITLNQAQEVRQLFLQNLARLPEDLFNRKVFKDGGLVDKKLLPKILEPGLNPVGPVNEERSAHEKLERRILKVELARKLGIGLDPIDAGASGSYFGRDVNRKIVVVFKPGSEESSGVNTPKLAHRIKNQIAKALGISLQGSFWPASGYISEAMSSELADHLNFDVLPRSTLTKLTSDQFVRAKDGDGAPVEEFGSAQLFVQGTKSADETFGLNSMGSIFGNIRAKYNVWSHKKEIKTKIDKGDFEMMAVIDGLILNRDRHFENWLVAKEPSPGAGGAHKIALIDHQLGFPYMNPPRTDSYYRRQQNKWVILPHAKKQFSADMRTKLEANLIGAPLQALLDNLQLVSQNAQVTDLNAKTFRDAVLDEHGHATNNSQEFAFKQRVATLLVAVRKSAPGTTMREYGGIKSLEEMIEFTQGVVDIQDPVALNTYLGLA